MGNSIYDQLTRGLSQFITAGGRSVQYRGITIPCSVGIGGTTTKLAQGGLQSDTAIHVKLLRSSVPIGQDGEPHTNEIVRFPPNAVGSLKSTDFVIDEVIADEYSYTFRIVDPSK